MSALAASLDIAARLRRQPVRPFANNAESMQVAVRGFLQ
jgi:hypothetical protein